MIIGGLITATLLTLIVLPTLYEWMVGRSWPDEPDTSGRDDGRLPEHVAS